MSEERRWMLAATIVAIVAAAVAAVLHVPAWWLFLLFAGLALI